MDNSFIAQANVFEENEPQDLKPVLREREAKLVKIIEALGQVEAADEWQTLKELYLDEIVKSLESRLVTEAKAKTINEPELYRLQGQLAWAKKYANLEQLRQSFKVELQNIRKQING